MHDAKHPPSFNSARWKAGYNPDTAFVNQTISSLCKKGVLDPVPRTQHRPISVSVHAAVTPTIRYDTDRPLKETKSIAFHVTLITNVAIVRSVMNLEIFLFGRWN